MTLLAISPDFASHYAPLAAAIGAARDGGRQVIVATGPAMRARVEADGFEWRELRLGGGANAGIVDRTPAVDRFLEATRRGPIATLRLQAHDRADDLLWQPEAVVRGITELCDRVDPDDIIVDHVSFGSTLAMRAIGRPFMTLVPGHPSQLPVGDERYGVPPKWPAVLKPSADDVAELEALVDRVGRTFTDRWNSVLERVAPHADPAADAFRVCGHRVLFNSPVELHDAGRNPELPPDHLFVGPLTRDEALPADFESWARRGGEPRVYVAFGTFLSHRADVLARISTALRSLGVRAAIATGATDPAALGSIPGDWIVAPSLPQVALLAHADLAIHHGGNNSVQESMAAGVRQVVLPFSTDQFANAFDLERTRRAAVASPSQASADELVEIVAAALADDAPAAIARTDRASLASALRHPDSVSA